MSEKYNGWTNHETWLVNLWMNESYDYWAEILQGARDTYQAATRIKEAHEELQELDNLPTTGVFSDLLGAALSRVNWDEIANHWLEDMELDREND